MATKKANIGYIIVVFYEGIGYTLQGRDEIHIFFHKGVKYYKNLKCAINKAQMLSTRYLNEGVYVFKIAEGERISCDQYKNWKSDDSHNMYVATSYMTK